MQRDHAIIPEVHQIAPRLQRSRVPQPFQILSLVPNGSVRALLLFFIQIPPNLYTAKQHFSCNIGPMQGMRASCDTELSKFFEPGRRYFEDVVGKRLKGEIRCPTFLPLIVSETMRLSNRHASTPFGELTAPAGKAQHTCV
jgi:hypothetical protein